MVFCLIFVRRFNDVYPQPSSLIGRQKFLLLPLLGALLLHISWVISPLQKCLSLFWTTVKFISLAVFFHLRDMPTHCAPTLYLPFVIVAPSAQIVSAIPLEPTARIFFPNPPFSPPHRKRLRRTDAEVVRVWIGLIRTQICISKPSSRKFILAVRHILSTKDSEFEHFLRC